MLSTYGSSGPFWHVLSCSVVPWLCLPWLFPLKPLVRKLMQMIPMMQVVMAAFPIALQEFLSKDMLASCSFELYIYIYILIYVVCLVFPSRFMLYVCVPYQISPYYNYSTWYLVPFRAAASHVKICQTSSMKESGSITMTWLQYYTVIPATYLLQIFGLIV